MYVVQLVCSGLRPRGRKWGRDQLITLGCQVKWWGLDPVAQSLTSFQQGAAMTNTYSLSDGVSVLGENFSLILRVFKFITHRLGNSQVHNMK